METQTSSRPNDVWIFQIPGNLTMSTAKNVFLTGGAQAKNIFWQVAGAVNIGANAHFEGIILSQTSINLETAASMNGRALAQTRLRWMPTSLPNTIKKYGLQFKSRVYLDLPVV